MNIPPARRRLEKRVDGELLGDGDDGAVAGGQKKKHPSAIPIDTNNGSSFQKTNDLEHRSHGFAHRSKDLDSCSKSMDLA